MEHKPEQRFQCNSGEIIPLDLPDDILQDIYFNNHARRHPQPRPLDPKLIVEDVRQLLKDLEENLIPHAKESEPTLEEDNLKTIESFFSSF